MSMKKAFDQTIRDLKREVNKKILKVPSIEQKVLDATSNEPWGPHGSILADIAHASRNYHEYQMVMTVIWKRINDIGKNWRHVYKALTVLEYLVAHGSERAIDEIREHAYQISTLSDFQYIDTSGTDQGNNVRRKSESLVLLVNDKERIQEVREKAATNRDKFRSTSAVGSMYRPGSGAYGDDRFEDRCGYGRDKDDERYGRYGDSYSREGDRYGRDSREHYARDMYRDDDSRGRSRSLHYQYGPRSQSADRDIDRAYDDDDRHSARPLERKFSEQNLSAPPSYEEAVGDTRVPTFGERDGEIPAGSAPQSSSSVADTDVQSSSPTGNVNHSQATGEHGTVSHPNMAADGFDEFDPRGSAAAAPTTTTPPAPSSSNNAEIDLFGSLSEVLSSNPLAVMPVSSGATEQADAINTASDTAFTAATSRNDASTQSFADPFGESPFKAILSDDPPAAQPQNSAPVSSFQPAANSVEHMQLAAQKLDTTANVDFPEALAAIDYAQTAPGAQYPTQDAQPSQDLDILAGILPPSGPLPSLPSSFSVSTGTPLSTSQTIFPSLSQTPAVGFMPQSAPSPTPFQQMAAQNMNIPSSLYQQTPYLYPSQLMSSNMGHQAQTGSLGHQNSGFLGDSLPQTGPTIPSSSQSASMSPLDLVHHQPSIEKQKFEPKSAVWADTLSKGLVDFNISGPKCNPTADIGVDFESLNRKEKRMEKPSITPTTSTVSMGKAMGLGSGIGRAGAGAIRPPSNPIMGPGMMGVGMGPGMGMRGYGSMNQQPMGMGMGMRQGGVTQPPNGAPHGASMGSYNPIMGRSGYTQQPYGGGYR